MKDKRKTINCPECQGKGYIPWGDKNDEIDECEVCEGHGEWIEDEEEMDKIYPQITDDEIEVMYEDFHGVIEAVEEYKRNDKNYRYA
jgi:RecJ-like exonuclease